MICMRTGQTNLVVGEKNGRRHCIFSAIYCLLALFWKDSLVLLAS